MIPKRPKHDPQRPQNDPKSPPKRIQEEAKRATKANPNGKTKKEPNQDDLKTVFVPLGPSKPQFGGVPGGPFWRPNRHQNEAENSSKTKRKLKRQKKPYKTILDPSWSDLGPSWAPSWADLDLRIVLWLKRRCFFEKSLFRS